MPVEPAPLRSLRDRQQQIDASSGILLAKFLVDPRGQQLAGFLKTAKPGGAQPLGGMTDVEREQPHSRSGSLRGNFLRRKRICNGFSFHGE